MSYTFFVRSDLVVTGTNPEMADMSNPRGEIIEEAFYVVAERPNGARWAHRFSTTDREKIDRVFNLIQQSGVLDLMHWDEIDPCYGSQAWVGMDMDRQRLNQERALEGLPPV